MSPAHHQRSGSEAYRQGGHDPLGFVTQEHAEAEGREGARKQPHDRAVHGADTARQRAESIDVRSRISPRASS